MHSFIRLDEGIDSITAVIIIVYTDVYIVMNVKSGWLIISGTYRVCVLRPVLTLKLINDLNCCLCRGRHIWKVPFTLPLLTDCKLRHLLPL
jgi:hypothetical protein